MPRQSNTTTKQSKRSQTLILIIIISFCVVNIQLVMRLDDHILGMSDSNNINVPQPQQSNIKSNNDNNHLSWIASHSHVSQITNNSAILDGDKGPIIEYFKLAGVELDDESIKLLPTWSQIQLIIGDEPVIYGLDKCEEYRNNIPPLRRMLGAAGMFNSGTNLATRLMKDNCAIPERQNEAIRLYDQSKITKEMLGIRWQVPWGKHTPVNFKYIHTAPKNENITKDDVLPIVTIRNPYDWMRSMCKIPYTARWAHQEGGIHGEICPHLVMTKSTSNNKIKVNLRAKLAERWINYDSLAHLWNEWYGNYWRESQFPFLIVRLEDLILRQYETTKIMCNCAGGAVPKPKSFKFAIDSAKFGPGHGNQEERTNLLKAWTRYSKIEVKSDFSDIDYEASKEFLDANLMKMMQYKYPLSE